MTFSSLILKLEAVTATRNYRKVFVPVSLSLENGECLYIEGVNGAGKTTLLRVLAGINTQYQGKIVLNQLERKEWVHKYCAHLIYLGHALGLKEDLTAFENLQSLLALRKIKPDRDRILEVFDHLSIPNQSRALRYLSAGQKRRVMLARLWLESAPLWILDEPFTALDQNSIILLEEKIIEHRKKNGVVIITSHQKPSNNVYTMNFTLTPHIHS